MKRTLTTCPYCGTGCQFYLVSDENGRLVGVEPSSTHVVAKGQLCVKGWNAFNFPNHPDRLTVPQIRKNGKFVEASWDEALDLVASKLKETQQNHGADSIAFFSSAKTTNEENYALMKLARAVFKTNNIDHCARLCHSSTVAGLAISFGSGAMTNSISCVEESDCILVTGSNTTDQHPLIGTRVIKAVKKGTKLIVADNRKIRLAELADMHIRCENGTDVAFLNGLMHVIIKEGLADDEFVRTRTENYDELKAMVEEFTPERTAEICKITPDEVASAARMFAGAERAMIIYSMGITQHSHGVDNVKTCANLVMLTGNVGKAGTGVNPLRGQNNVQGACDMGALPNVYTGYQPVVNEASRAKFQKAWGVENLPGNVGLTVTTAINAAYDGGLKALYVMGENPMMSDPDQHHVKAALEKLDFLVVQDIFPTPTTALADVVLPAACYSEKDGTFTSTERRCQRVRKACDPPGKARQDWEIIGEIAGRMGYDGLTYVSPEEIMDEIAEVTPIYGGMQYDRIDQVGLQWPCPDRNHPGTPVLHKGKFTRGLGLFSPAPYKSSMELPDDEYPFVLSTGRCYFHFHTGTMTRRSRLLDREERFPYVEVHPDDAKRLRIYDRFPVMVLTRRGEVKALARVSDVVIPGHLFMTFHFEEGAANVLTINALDPVAKIPEFKVCAAQVRRGS
ncbi:MAG: formate dehydrogenase subunit alpha [Candidatus Coatesbacteria bacterium]|nr:formate dehydrogenase subunit alpha [Candidatus Coatesbacteria bacterium]